MVVMPGGLKVACLQLNPFLGLMGGKDSGRFPPAGPLKNNITSTNERGAAKYLFVDF